MVYNRIIYTKTTISKKNHKKQKIRPFDIFWFKKTIKNQNLKKQSSPSLIRGVGLFVVRVW